MKPEKEKKLSSKLSEKVSSKTIKEMLKDFYKMLRLECLVDFEELKSQILQKEQELLKENKRLKEDIHNRVVEKIHLKMQPLFNDAKLEEENQELKKNLLEKDGTIRKMKRVIESHTRSYFIQKKEIERLNNQLQEKINYVNTIDEINAGLEYQADNLEQRLKEHRKRIELMIEHFEFLGSSGDNYAKNVTKKLKSLLESEKDDNQHQAERDSHTSVDVGSYPSENPRGEQTLQHFG